MDWWSIVIKGLKKRKKHTLIILSGIFFGTFMMTVVFSTFVGMKERVEEDIAKYGVTFTFKHDSSAQQISYRGVPLMLESSVKQVKMTHETVDLLRKSNQEAIGISPRAVKTFTHDTGSELAIVGVDLANEQKMKPWWKVWGKWPSNENEVLLGYDIAQKFNYRAGDTINTTVEGTKYTFKIAGYLHYTGYVDDRLIYTSIGQPFFSGGIDFVEAVFPEEVVPTEALTGAGWTWTKTKNANQERIGVVEQISHITPIIFLVALLMGAVVTGVTLLSQVEERRKEFAIWRAVGMSRKWVIKILLGEVSCLALVGSIAGWGLGFGLALVMASLMSGFKFLASIPFEQSLFIILVSVLVSIASASYPIFLALRQDSIALLKN